MNIQNYEARTNELIGEYITSLSESKRQQFVDVNKKVTDTLSDLKSLAKNNPSEKENIDKKIEQLNEVQKDLNKRISTSNDIRRNRFGNRVHNARRYIGAMHRMTEAPVDFVKRGLGL